MGIWQRLFGPRPASAETALYAAVVERARAPHWYEAGAVPDTVDGRFDMLATVLALVILRLERDPADTGTAARLTELFVTDMDAQMREIGIGDVVVGKHVGKMMGALGGRIGAMRAGLAGELEPVLVRNLYRGEAPGAAALAHSAAGVRALADGLARTATADLLAGALPR